MAFCVVTSRSGCPFHVRETPQRSRKIDKCSPNNPATWPNRRRKIPVNCHRFGRLSDPEVRAMSNCPQPNTWTDSGIFNSGRGVPPKSNVHLPKSGSSNIESAPSPTREVRPSSPRCFRAFHHSLGYGQSARHPQMVSNGDRIPGTSSIVRGILLVPEPESYSSHRETSPPNQSVNLP